MRVNDLLCDCRHAAALHREFYFTNKTHEEVTSGPCMVTGCMCRGVHQEDLSLFPLELNMVLTSTKTEQGMYPVRTSLYFQVTNKIGSIAISGGMELLLHGEELQKRFNKIRHEFLSKIADVKVLISINGENL